MAKGVRRLFDCLHVVLAMLKTELKSGRQVGEKTNSNGAGDMGIRGRCGMQLLI